MVGFGYDIGSLKDEKNPIAQAYFTIFEYSHKTLFLFGTLLMALFPALGRLPFSWIRRSEDAIKVLINNATQIIDSRVEKSLDTGDERDILACMLKENERLHNIGEKGLSRDEMVAQILTFLVAGYHP